MFLYQSKASKFRNDYAFIIAPKQISSARLSPGRATSGHLRAVLRGGTLIKTELCLQLLRRYLSIECTFEVLVSLLLNIRRVLQALDEVVFFLLKLSNLLFNVHSPSVLLENAVDETVTSSLTLILIFLSNIEYSGQVEIMVHENATYQCFALFGIHLLTANHLLDAVVLGGLLVALPLYHHRVALRLLLQSLRLGRMLQLSQLGLLPNGPCSARSRLSILLGTERVLPLASQALGLLPGAVFLISLTSVPYLIGLALRLRNLLPSLTLLHLEQRNTIGEESRVIGRLLLVDSRGLESSADFALLSIGLRAVIVIILLIAIFLLVLILHLFLLSWHGLISFRRVRLCNMKFLLLLVHYVDACLSK